MEDKTYELTMLFDFFGELLPEKQREYFDLRYGEDLSLSEIAELVGVTRQGVHDVLVKAEAALRSYEERTGVVSRFLYIRSLADSLGADLDRLALLSGSDEARALAASMSEKLVDIKTWR